MRIVVACIIVLAIFLSCQNPNTPGDNTASVLQKTDFICRSSDYSNFCKNVYDSTTVAYRNSDTLLIIVRNVVECPPVTLDYQIKNDTLELKYGLMGLHICVDTLRYTYLEYGFKVVSEGNLRVIAQDSAGTFKSLDTVINTTEATIKYECR